MFIFGRKYKEKIKKLEKKVNTLELFIEEKINGEMESIMPVRINLDIKNFRIFHISTYNIKCGIADFEKNLIEGFENNFKSYHFIMPIKYSFNIKVSTIFKYLNRMIDEISNGKFNLVEIQYEYSFFSCNEIIDKALIDSIFEYGDEVDPKLINNYIFKSLLFLDYLLTAIIKLNLNIIITWHTGFEEIFKKLYQGIDFYKIPVLRYFNNKNLNVVVLEKSMKNTLVKNGVPTDNVNDFFIPISAKIKQTKDIDLIKQIEDKYNINKDDKILATFGFIAEYKGILNVCKSMLYLPNNYKYLILGGVHDRHMDNFIGRLKDFIVKNGLQDRVFISGFIDEKYISSYINLIDLAVYLYNTNYSFASAAINNILLFNKPVLSSKSCSFVSLHEKYDCIELCDDIDNYRNIAKSIINLLEDCKRLNELEENTKKFCKENTFQVLANKYLDLFKVN